MDKFLPFSSSMTGGVLLLGVPDAMFVALIVYFICLPLLFRRKRTGRKVLLCLLFLYIGALAALTMRFVLPTAWHVSAENTRWALHCINWMPLQSSLQIWKNCLSIGDMGEFIRIVVGNFVMLMPLGILVPMLDRRFRFGKTLLLGMGVSLSIELLQLLGNVLGGAVARSVEIDDVILNVLGCAAAYLILAACRRLFGRKRRR